MMAKPATSSGLWPALVANCITIYKFILSTPACLLFNLLHRLIFQLKRISSVPRKNSFSLNHQHAFFQATLKRLLTLHEVNV